MKEDVAVIERALVAHFENFSIEYLGLDILGATDIVHHFNIKIAGEKDRHLYFKNILRIDEVCYWQGQLVDFIKYSAKSISNSILFF